MQTIFKPVVARCVPILVLTAMGVGCDPAALESFAELGNALAGLDGACEEYSRTVPLPESVPQELLIDDSDPEVAGQIPNSLGDVPMGTVMDELAKLDGCWTRQDPDPQVAREVMKFDIAQNRMTMYILGPPTESWFWLPNSMKSDLPYFSTKVWDVTILAENKIELNWIEGEGAAFDGEGKTSFYCAVVEGGGMENYLTAALTLDGDSLKYLDSYEDLDPANQLNELSAEYWVRFDCP